MTTTRPRRLPAMRALLSSLLSFTSMLCLVPQAAADESAELPAAFKAIVDNAARLRSGQYRAQGRIKSRYWTEGPDSRRETMMEDEYDEFIEADFNFDANRNSFRRQRVHLGGPMRNRDHAEQFRWYLSIPGLTVLLRGTEQGRTAILRDPTSWIEIWPNEISERLPQPIFDPRLLGWSGWGSLCVPFETVADNWLRKAELRAADEGNGIHRIEAWNKVEEGLLMVQTWWMDEQQGWQPVRWSARWHYAGPTKRAEEKNARTKPHEESEHSWEKHGDVWVLKTLAARIRDSRENDLELSFDWKTVNQPISAERFDWKTWRFPEDYGNLEDWRLGGRRPINVTDHRSSPDEQNLPVALRPVEETPDRSWLLIVNVALISFVTGWLARRFLVSR